MSFWYYLIDVVELLQLDIFYTELYLFFSVVYSFNSRAFSSIVFIPVSLRWLSICQNWLARPFPE